MATLIRKNASFPIAVGELHPSVVDLPREIRHFVGPLRLGMAKWETGAWELLTGAFHSAVAQNYSWDTILMRATSDARLSFSPNRTKPITIQDVTVFLAAHDMIDCTCNPASENLCPACLALKETLHVTASC